MNTVRPRCFGTSQFVRARHRPQSAHHAPVVQIFDPLSTHSSPSRTAVVCAPATSDPPRRLRQELHPDLVAAEDGREVLALLLLGAEVEEHGGARLQRGHLEARRDTRSRQISSLNACWCAAVRPWPPYSSGKQMPANPPSNSVRCRSRWCCDLRELLLVGVPAPRHEHAGARSLGRGMLSGSHARSRRAELLDRLDVRVRHGRPPSPPTIAVSRWRWSETVPKSSESTTTRRR